MRQQVSLRIREDLVERARDFHIILDDVSITDLTFSKEYAGAVESKQVRDFYQCNFNQLTTFSEFSMNTLINGLPLIMYYSLDLKTPCQMWLLCLSHIGSLYTGWNVFVSLVFMLMHKRDQMVYLIIKNVNTLFDQLLWKRLVEWITKSPSM